MRDAIRRRLWSAGFDPRLLGRLRWLKKVHVLRLNGASPRRHLAYVLADPEIDNFTYELANEDELASSLAAAFSVSPSKVAELLLEARSCRPLYEQLRAATSRRFSMKTEPPLGRRLGWYVIVRLLKPTRIIETGIHDGLGSLVLLSALDRNAAEGAPGELVSFDVDSTAGWIVGDHPQWSRRIESTRTGLAPALCEAPAQLFIHDSLHTFEHEFFELDTAASHLASGGVLISDNSHVTNALAQVCAAKDAEFFFFRERPRNHFYAGGGIGIGKLPEGQ